MNKEELTAMVAEILNQMEPTVKGGDYRPANPGPQARDTHYQDGDFVEDVTKLDLRKLYRSGCFCQAKGENPCPVGLR